MINNIYSHWDWGSMIFYFFLSVVGCFSLVVVKKRECKTGKKQSIISFPYIVWFILWTIVASYRYVGHGVGGADALAYIYYFKNCFSSNLPSYYTHYDLLFQFINKFIRFFTGNYYLFFILIYGFIVYSIILFVNEFCPKKTNFIPFVLMFYIYLRSFNTLRSNLAIAFILISLVLFNKEKKVFGYLLLFSSFFIHKAAIIYILIVVLYKMYQNNKIKLRHCIWFAVIFTMIAQFTQSHLLPYFGDSLNGAYVSYSRRSLYASFFDNYWKIAFGQLLLLLFIVVFNRTINNYIISIDENGEKRRIKNIFTLCCFDLSSVYLTYILGMWRGYEFLYLARLILWSQIIYIIQQKVSINTKRLINIITVIVFMFYLYNRIYSTWDDSNLMPYVFGPFYW